MREEYALKLLRVTEKEEKKSESEFIHVRLDAVPPINIIGVYLETGQPAEKAEQTHKILTEIVKRSVDQVENYDIMGDLKAAINPDPVMVEIMKS